MTDTSAETLAVLANEALSLSGFGSVVPVVSTVAVFVMAPPGNVAITVALTVKASDPPTARSGAVQVTVCPLTEQPGAVMSVSEVGSVSLTVTPRAREGPLLVAVRVYEIGPPA
ncbi:MAG TPA: hypothetical protein VH419_13155, partial [Nocardioidaceae bacterium]